MKSVNWGTLLQLRFGSNFSAAGVAWLRSVDQHVRKKRGRSIELTAGDVNKQAKQTNKQTNTHANNQTNKQTNKVLEKSVNGAQC